MERSPRKASYDDILRAPEHLVAEIVDGELLTTPRPASPHARAASIITGELVGSFDHPQATANRPGGWWILVEPELHLAADVIVPDVAGWRRERMPLLPNVPAFTQPPDWVGEVVSPNTAGVDRVKKMRIYAREEVGFLWLVDPILRTLEVYRLERGRWMVASTHAGAERARPEPFAAIELDLSRWWLET